MRVFCRSSSRSVNISTNGCNRSVNCLPIDASYLPHAPQDLIAAPLEDKLIQLPTAACAP
jgi:hypothetical protein